MLGLDKDSPRQLDKESTQKILTPQEPNASQTDFYDPSNMFEK